MILGGILEGGEAQSGELIGMALCGGELVYLGTQEVNGMAQLLGNEGGLGVDG
jgi:hypothetical protein